MNCKQFVKIILLKIFYKRLIKMMSMHAIVKILPVNYILKGNLSKFIANNLRYTVERVCV